MLYSLQWTDLYLSMRISIVIGMITVGIGLAFGSFYFIDQRDAGREVAATEAAKKPPKLKQQFETPFNQATKQSAPAASSFESRSTDTSTVSSKSFYESIQPADADLIKALGLNESDAYKFLQIRTDQQRRIQELALQGTATFAGDAAGDLVRNDTNQQLRDMLGDQQFAEYTEYQLYESEHKRISQLNARLGETGQPKLGEDQQQWLFAVMKEERNRIPPPHASGFGSAVEFVNATKQWRSEIESRIINRASAMLTPAQLDMFKKVGK
jgi:hypothetical protein